MVETNDLFDGMRKGVSTKLQMSADRSRKTFASTPKPKCRRDRAIAATRPKIEKIKTQTMITRSKKASGRKNASRKKSASGKVKQPKSPMSAQHQAKPGLESKMKPRPHYEAPLYRGSGKLKDKVALITGGDSGIGRAVA